ncbi:unnamed protein product [Durusdinium trenchii]
MFRDILVSSIIFLALCPLVLLSGISEFICPTFSIHHLIIYRQPGHTDRENLDFDPILIRMCFEEEDSEEGLDHEKTTMPPTFVQAPCQAPKAVGHMWCQ